MAEGIGVNVKGFDALAKELGALPDDMRKKVVRSGLRAGTKAFQQSLERNAPIRRGDPRPIPISKGSSQTRFQGFLSRHIRIKKVRPSRAGPGKEAYWTGPASDAFYGMIQAMGGRFGNWRLRPNPWIERAYKARADAIEDTFSRAVTKYLKRYAQKSDQATKAAKSKAVS